MDTQLKCDCGEDGEELHPCPLKEEVRGDSETLCNCCEDCQRQCFMDT